MRLTVTEKSGVKIVIPITTVIIAYESIRQSWDRMSNRDGDRSSERQYKIDLPSYPGGTAEGQRVIMSFV